MGGSLWHSFLSHPTAAVNKRLDEWVTHERLDLKKIQFPKKEAKTPTKNGLPGSRPGSPEREVVSRSLLHLFSPAYFSNLLASVAPR